VYKRNSSITKSLHFAREHQGNPFSSYMLKGRQVDVAQFVGNPDPPAVHQVLIDEDHEVE
jgi:hypothetical protein